MYFFFHLITGIVLGLLLADLFRDGRWLVPCAAGAILPDLIDKPAGLLLFQGIFGTRTVFHSLLALAVVLGIGLLLLRYRGSPVLTAVAAGILSHQVLDAMWNEPAVWLYPFGGTLVPEPAYPLGYLLALARADLLDPSEWAMAGLLVAGFLLYLEKDRLLAMALRHRKGLALFLEGSGVVLLAGSGLVIARGLLRTNLSHGGRAGFGGFIVPGIFLALSAFLLWRWGSRLATPSAGQEAGAP